MASSWLRWLLAEGRREPAHLPGQELQPPHVAASLELCPAVALPWASQLWALSCVLLRPQMGKEGRENGEAAGEGGKRGRGGASISNFIINTLFCKVGACFCQCTQPSGQSVLCGEGVIVLSSIVLTYSLFLGGTGFTLSTEHLDGSI